MFNSLPIPAADPILSVAEAFRHDTREHKLDLGIGVYRDTNGQTPVMGAVKAAAITLANEQASKSYIGPAGNPRFNQAVMNLMLGPAYDAAAWVTVQTPGASGGLRLLADLIAASQPQACVWLSNPSYVNHAPIMQAAGLRVASYPYLNENRTQLDRDGFFDTIRQLGPRDVVLLHGCCHNPSGVDLNKSDWRQLASMASAQGFIPFVDLAYQGFGEGLQEDAMGLQILAEAADQMLAVYSCSKHFGLYRERTGAALVKSADPQRLRSKLFELARRQYTMPPDHGAEIVARIMESDTLRHCWQAELVAMRHQIIHTRHLLAQALNVHGIDAGYLRQHKGMFSMLPLNDMTIDQLRHDSAIYLVAGGRINLAGLPHNRINDLAVALANNGLIG
ncbi:aromatic amino acid transaminase [Chitinivorax sp. B]|uniref:amino acid aminotransferase n=1 Tax=Chitinivorax sp. B TaxID=2502235 RepID=UPI0010F51F8A|nr:aromatic amino acid transaminase [Chitinivorax sp. B]